VLFCINLQMVPTGARVATAPTRPGGLGAATPAASAAGGTPTAAATAGKPAAFNAAAPPTTIYSAEVALAAAAQAVEAANRAKLGVGDAGTPCL